MEAQGLQRERAPERVSEPVLGIQRRRSPAPRYATVYDAIAALTIQQPGENGCLLWRNRGGRGYPTIRFRGTQYAAHKLAWVLHNAQDIPAGMNVLHDCDNYYCVRGDHLLLGTQRENVADVYCRQRWNAQKVKLNWQKARWIRQNEPFMTRKAMAEELDVSLSAVHNVLSGKSWVPRCNGVSK